MKLFNRGQRTFNPNTPIAIKPGKWSPELTEEQGTKLLKMYPRELTSNEGEASRHNAQLIEAEQKVRDLETENKKLRDQVAGLQKLVSNDPLSANINPGLVPEAVDIPATPATPAPAIAPAKAATPAKTGKSHR
jgi:hypothetical protein